MKPSVTVFSDIPKELNRLVQEDEAACEKVEYFYFIT